MRNMFRASTWIALIAVLILAGSALNAAQHEHKATKVTVGQKGEVTFTAETRIADIMLKPGRYYLDHRVEGTTQPRRVAAHYIHFTEVTPAEHQKRQAARDTLGKNAVVSHPGEIECELEALEKRAALTTVFTVEENGVRRITRIEIAGENVAHVF